MSTGKSVFIPCKPYVKQYLIQNFGEPVNLYPAANPYLTFFRSCLSDPTPKYAQRTPCNNCTMIADRELPLHVPKARNYHKEKVKTHLSNLSRTHLVEFVISETDFYTYGWMLKPIQIAAINACFEQNVKGFMRTSIMVDFAISGSMSDSIRRFQNNYGYSEEIWSYESIKKDLYRHSDYQKISFHSEIYTKIQKIVTVQLSDLGTISKSNKIKNGNVSKSTQQSRGHRKNLGDPIQPSLWPSAEPNGRNVQTT